MEELAGLELEGEILFWFAGECATTLDAWGPSEPGAGLESGSSPIGDSFAIRSARLRRPGGFDAHLDGERRAPWTAVRWHLLERLHAAGGEAGFVPGARAGSREERKAGADTSLDRFMASSG